MWMAWRCRAACSVCSRASSESQSAGLLLEVEHAPLGLGAGARLRLWLYGRERSGMLLPREAILYDENGAYVYKQLAVEASAEKTHYLPVKVTLLLPLGRWLAGAGGRRRR